jgi:hypothetical protein
MAPTPQTFKKLPTWRDNNDADRSLQSADLNEYRLEGEPLVECLERQEGPTLETLHADLGRVLERLTELSASVEELALELTKRERNRRVVIARRVKAATARRAAAKRSKG